MQFAISPEAVRRGRPADAAKRAAILAAAQHLFTSGGYTATAMDAVAVRAGVSKLTVYRHFDTKAGLFAAAIAAKCRDMLAGLDTLAVGGGAHATLTAAGAAFLALILHPDALAVHRLVTGERATAPELGGLFHQHAAAATGRRIAALIAALIAQGDVTGDAAVIADDFLALLRSKPLLHLELGVDVFDADALAAHVAHCADVVLAAYAPR